MEDSSTLAKLKTQVALLQKDAKTGEQIHQRLEIAIGKLNRHHNIFKRYVGSTRN